jgi:hypothetical protein
MATVIRCFIMHNSYVNTYALEGIVPVDREMIYLKMYRI